MKKLLYLILRLSLLVFSLLGYMIWYFGSLGEGRVSCLIGVIAGIIGFCEIGNISMVCSIICIISIFGYTYYNIFEDEEWEYFKF